VNTGAEAARSLCVPERVRHCRQRQTGISGHFASLCQRRSCSRSGISDRNTAAALARLTAVQSIQVPWPRSSKRQVGYWQTRLAACSRVCLLCSPLSLRPLGGVDLHVPCLASSCLSSSKFQTKKKKKERRRKENNLNKIQYKYNTIQYRTKKVLERIERSN